MSESYFEDTPDVRAALHDAVGKQIREVQLASDVTIVFEDGSAICFADHNQECCEHRFFSGREYDCVHMAGSTFLGVNLRDADESSDECQLNVFTTHGRYTFTGHIVDDGCTGGSCVFGITCFTIPATHVLALQIAHSFQPQDLSLLRNAVRDIEQLPDTAQNRQLKCAANALENLAKRIGKTWQMAKVPDAQPETAA